MGLGMKFRCFVCCQKVGWRKKTSFNNCVAYRARPSLWLKTKRRNDI